jgi:hypothetical protein
VSRYYADPRGCAPAKLARRKEIVFRHDSFSGNEIPRDELACFCRRGWCIFESLDLGHQCIGNNGIAALVEGLANNSTLEFVLNCTKSITV